MASGEAVEHFKDGMTIYIQCTLSSKNLRLKPDGALDVNGGNKKAAQWRVNRLNPRKNPPKVRLESVSKPGEYLRITKKGNLDTGRGGEYCEFEVLQKGGECVFESLKFSKWHVGGNADGSLKLPVDTGTGKHAQFHCIFALPPVFKNGNTIHFKNNLSGKQLRAPGNGGLDVNGGTGKPTQWRVKRMNPREKPVKCTFESIQHPGKYLRINKEGELDLGGGGSLCEFVIEQKEGDLIIQSIAHSSWHVGGNKDGSLKTPKQTGTGAHARFSVHLFGTI